jgi:SAM-dependent methyltransferase
VFFALLSATATFSLLYAPREHLSAFLTVYGVTFALFILAYRQERGRLNAMKPRDLIWILVLSGLCLRAATAIAPTSLSDDIFRYVWDARVLLAGINPYRESPGGLYNAGVVLDATFGHLNSPKYYSVYPPLAQSFFAAVTAIADGAGLPADRLLRLALGLVDGVTIGLLALILIRLKRPPAWAALYAWNPMVAWEVAGGGHSESLLLVFLCLAVLAVLSDRVRGVGLMLGLAALAKLSALILAPILGWMVCRRRGFAAAAVTTTLTIVVIAVGYAPFWFGGLIDRTGESLSLYFGVFIFNTPLFDIARWVLGYREGWTPDVSGRILPIFTTLTLTVVAVATVAVKGQASRLPAALFAACVAYLLFSTVIHPWYLLVPLAFGVLAGSWAIVLWSGLIGLTYLAYLPGGHGVPFWVLVVEYVPVFLLFAVDGFRAALIAVLEQRARRKYRSFRRYLPPGSRLLDIGAGEGFVAEVAASDGHAPFLVDVNDANRTDLPHRIYDGRTLPYEADSFDIGLLSYVLHHCDDPPRVLGEAARVCKKLIVLESVYETEFDHRLLSFLDHLANWFRGIRIEPLHFDRVEGWRARFDELGLAVEAECVLGRFVHKHRLFVLTRC